jgi:hypothetical protein
MSLPSFMHFPYRRVRQADDRMVSRLLKVAGLCTESELGAEIDALLRQRMSDCRDLFALRGVRRPRRLTVLRLTGRRLGQDADCVERMASLSAEHGPTLLQAVCVLAEKVGQSGFPRRRAEGQSMAIALPPVAAAAAPAVEDAEASGFTELDDAILALADADRQRQDAVILRPAQLHPAGRPQLLAA